MARIPVHTLGTAPEGSRDGLQAIHDRFGKAMNIQAEMAHNPVVLKVYLAFKDILHNDESRSRERTCSTSFDSKQLGGDP
jgi:hypothetical protein